MKAIHRVFGPLRYLLMIVVAVSGFITIIGTGGGGGTATYSITGQIQGGVVASVSIALSGDSTGTTTSDQDGNFSFSNLANGNYTLTAALANYTFAPASLAVTIENADSTGHVFTATGVLSGTVSGDVAADVTLYLDGPENATATTDSSGNYQFTGLTSGSYSLTPSKSGFNFTPTNRVVNFTGVASTGNDFTAATAYYTVTGAVSGGALASVTVNLSGDVSGTTTTDVNGDFSIGNLTNGSYTLTPTLANYTFSPAALNFTILDGNVTVQDFVATGVVSGTVSGDVANGVTIHLSGASTASTITAGGGYRFEGLIPGDYILTPELAGYTFDPLSIAINFSGVATTANNFVATVNANTASISGTVSGDISANVPITLSYLAGADLSSTITDINGDYSFNGLVKGSDYQVTASRTDYTFAPPSIDILNLQSDTSTNNFTATSDQPDQARYTVSGSVSYGGSETGVIYIMLQHPDGHMSMHGTSIDAAGPYQIRGVTDGDYSAVAIMDKFGNGYFNAADPMVTTPVAFSVIGSNVANIDVVLADPTPPTPLAPTLVIAAPFDQGVTLLWESPYVKIGEERFEIADAYDVSWSTSNPVGPNYSGTVIVPAGGEMGHYILEGANGDTLYISVQARVGANSSGVTTIGPVTVGTVTGGSSISGEVSFSGTATGPLYVAVLETGAVATPALYVTAIASPTSPQSYSVSGLEDGSYQVVAAIDMNNNDLIMDLGDLSAETMDDRPSIDIAGNDVIWNMSLNAENVLARVATVHTLDVNANEFYELRTELNAGLKRPVRSVLNDGPGINGPVDLANRHGVGRFEGYFGNIAQPAPGDAYSFDLTYTDASTATISTGVTAVLDSFATPIAPVGDVSGDIHPTFSWTAPSVAPPPVYFYRLEVHSGYESIWDLGNLIPSSTTSVEYNFDGRASLDPLTSGQVYNWSLDVMDENGNRASIQTEFTP